jgi:hypothetical protein
MESVLEALAIPTDGLTSLARGRAGLRAAQLARIAQHLSALSAGHVLAAGG